MSNKEIQEKLEQVRQSYIATLGEKKNNLEILWDKLKSNWDQDTYENFYIIIHGLAGSAETFGLPELTREARSITDYLKAHKKEPKDTVFVEMMDGRLAQLLSLMDRSNDCE